ncbi:hypothetical protein GGX14DRAFT_405760 [Mycena pura]|uniref:Uncharacterized protein n=1 Tax=Mycena pura TaxID=153505 RepID=A0AAD6Y274_9AGAR|nr:hypothetical protein GGX14DRAFT_405760 [Mycena pura]
MPPMTDLMRQHLTVTLSMGGGVPRRRWLNVAFGPSKSVIRNLEECHNIYPRVGYAVLGSTVGNAAGAAYVSHWSWSHAFTRPACGRHESWHLLPRSGQARSHFTSGGVSVGHERGGTLDSRVVLLGSLRLELRKYVYSIHGTAKFREDKIRAVISENRMEGICHGRGAPGACHAAAIRVSGSEYRHSVKPSQKYSDPAVLCMESHGCSSDAWDLTLRGSSVEMRSSAREKFPYEACIAAPLHAADFK